MRTGHRHISRFRAGALWAAALGAGVVGTLASPGVPGGSAAITLSGQGGAAVADARTPRAPVAGRFAISGQASGLYPGATLPLVLTVANPEPYGIVVTSITTSVGSVSAACPGTLVSVTAFAGKQAVPALASRQVTVHVSLAHAAPNACQGADFPFRYSGTGKRA